MARMTHYAALAALAIGPTHNLADPQPWPSRAMEQALWRKGWLRRVYVHGWARYAVADEGWDQLRIVDSRFAEPVKP